MKLAVYGSNDEWQTLKNNSSGINWIDVSSAAELFVSDADALFYLDNDISGLQIASSFKPVFVNSVIHTIDELGASPHITRFNGWPGFIEQSSWQLSSRDESYISIMNALGKEFIRVQDEPGFITPRILAMVINEAFYALDESVSTKEEIDTAMKLGTNYPFGPFEWSEKIGIKNIYALLMKLSVTDSRYTASASLIKSIAS